MAKRRPPSQANDTAASPALPKVKAPRARAPRRSLAMAGPDNATTAAPIAPPTEADIRHRAYLRYLERGGDHGGEFDDWLYAERELKKA
jgi:hypothetical protein